MKNNPVISVSFLAVFLFILSSFSIGVNPKPLDSKDDIPVEAFNSVSVAISANIYIEQGNSHKLEIDASPEAMKKIDIHIEDGKLIIKPVNYRVNIKEDIDIYIVAPDYEAISLSGSGKLFAEKTLKLEELMLKIAGSGSMSFEDLSAGKKLEMKISGSGDIDLKGNGAEEMKLSIAGSGNVESTNFKVGILDAKISGSGDCKVWVTEGLDAFIAGSGSVLYKGSPEVDTSVAGSGKVRKL